MFAWARQALLGLFLYVKMTLNEDQFLVLIAQAHYNVQVSPRQAGIKDDTRNDECSYIVCHQKRKYNSTDIFVLSRSAAI